MTCKVYACPKRMLSPGINGEGELRGNRLTQVHLEKWLLKWSVCVFSVWICTMQKDDHRHCWSTH